MATRLSRSQTGVTMHAAVTVVNVMLSAGIFNYTQDMQRRMTTLEANMAIVMQTVQISTRQPETPSKSGR